MNIYSVRPFSGLNYYKNQNSLKDGQEGCAICGKYVAQPFRHEATVVHGGQWARTEAEANYYADNGYMGVWGIGADCHKKYLVKNLEVSE